VRLSLQRLRQTTKIPFMQFQYNNMANKNIMLLLSVEKQIIRGPNTIQFSYKKINHQPGEFTITKIYHQRMQEQNTSQTGIF
jgi:hypothetical protein